MRVIHAALILLVAGTAARARAQSVRVADDPRAELIGILFRVAGANDFRAGSVQPFIRQVDSAFAPYASHPVFSEIRKLRASDPGLALSAVIGLAPQLTDPIALAERVPLDAPDSRAPQQWHGTAARPFLAQARLFARDAHVAEFLRLEQPTFDSASTRLRRMIDSTGRMDWFGAFFGEPVGHIIVSPLLISGSGNFGAEFGSGGTHERYAFVSFTHSDSEGFPMPLPDALEQMVHELNHTFVNHVVAEDSAALRASGERMFTTLGRTLNEMGYGSWLVMYQESLVRAGVIRYLMAADGPNAALRETRAQQGRGFVWMDRLVDLLGAYEAHRDRYTTFVSFMPRIVAFYDSLAPNVAEARAEFERHRPSVVSASIANHDTVSAGVTTIVIRFDRRVHGFGSLVGEYGGEVPTITSSEFDSTGTVLTLGLRLAPNHSYWLPFGPGAFADAEGYPLRDWELRFRTR